MNNKNIREVVAISHINSLKTYKTYSTLPPKREYLIIEQ